MISICRGLWQKTTLKIVFMMAVVLGLMLISGACTKTVYVMPSSAPILVVTPEPTPPPTQVITPAPTLPPTEVITPPPTPPPTQAEQTLATAYNIVLSGGYSEYLPANGAYVQAGKTLTLSWSADGNLEGYIFTQTQFNNFKPLGIPSGYQAYSSGSSQTIYATITNSDTYYGVVTNRVMFASPVKLYQATFTEQ
jgi:hypothetical protein